MQSVVRKLLSAVLAVGMVAAVSAACWAAPNIVFIMADDLGYGDTGLTGQNARALQGLPAIQTPNIDALAMAGVQYNNMYAGGPACAQSRAVFLTGFHMAHTHMDRVNLDQDIRGGEEDATFGQVLQQAGYETGLFGKWHMGGTNSWGSGIRTFSALPTQKGFEEYYGPMFGVYRLTAHFVSDGNGSVHQIPVPQEPSWPGPGLPYVYGDDLITNRAVDFIRAKAAGDQPFMTYLALTEPHAPFAQVPQDHPYANMPWPKVQRDYAGLIWKLDQHVKQVVDAIEDPNGDGDTSDSIADNTIIMFASDNGPVIPGVDGGFDPHFFDSNGIYSGFKTNMFEGGIRTPFFVRWDGKIAPGTVNDSHVGSFVDLLPTFAELAGQEAPLGVDGRSMVSSLLGGPESSPPLTTVWGFQYEVGPLNPGGMAIRVGDWKLIKRRPSLGIANPAPLLYNVVNDPSELVNLANSRPDIRNALEAIAAAEGIVDEPLGPARDNPLVSEFKNTYFTQYKTWAPQDGSLDFASAANWSGGTERVTAADPEALYWNTGPAANWLATMVNSDAEPQHVTLAADAAVLALGVAGSAGEMRLTIPEGRLLSARNGVRISDGGVVNLAGGELNTVREVEIRPGGRLEAEGTITGQQHVLAGIPEFAGLKLFVPHVDNEGELQVGVGAEAGTLQLEGSYQQGAGGLLQIDLFGSGAVAGVDFDQLAVAEHAVLDGLLDIAIAPGGWTPQLGDTFDILVAAGGITGTFGGASAPALSGGLGWDFVYTPTTVTLQVIQQALGDLTIVAGGPMGAAVAVAAVQPLEVAGTLWVGSGDSPGDLTIAADGKVNVGVETRIESAGVVRLLGGQLSTPQLTIAAGGAIDWQSGELHLVGDATVGPDSAVGVALGAGLTIGPERHLNVAGTALLDAPLTLGGGTFTAGQIGGLANLNFDSGTLNLLNANLLVDPAGPFGAALELHADSHLNIGGTTIVSAGATINVHDAASFTSEVLENHGTITLGGPTARLTGASQLLNAGVLQGHGAIEGYVSNDNGGQIVAENGEKLQLLGPVDNFAEMRATGSSPSSPSELEFSEQVTNFPGALITSSDGTVRFHGGLDNHGQLRFSGGQSQSDGPIDNSAQVEVVDGATATFHGDFDNNGTLRVNVLDGAPSTAVFMGNVTGHGGATGGGNIVFEADVSPGNSVGTMALQTNVEFGAASSLTMELGGLAGIASDQFLVDGTVSLAGSLVVELINNFIPQVGQSFTIVTSTFGIEGTFDQATLPNIAGIEWQLNYSLQTVMLQAVEGTPEIQADFDGDGDVDGNDFLAWQRGLGKTDAQLSDGDANGDGVVDAADLEAWRAAFGSQASANAVADAVPEPATGGLALAAVGVLAAVRSRRGARGAGVDVLR